MKKEKNNIGKKKGRWIKRTEKVNCFFSFETFVIKKVEFILLRIFRNLVDNHFLI